LLEAFRVLGATERAELWIIGDETSDPAYVSNLRELATSRVSFLGKQPRHAVWKLLSQVDVVVVPSLWYEAYAFVVSEAFAAGAPVVASRLGTLVDRVEHEVDGLLVPPGDVVALSEALGRLVREPDLLLRLRGGLRPVRTFDAHITDLEATYASVLSAP
jgi:glycosyltransferase involved in cell wall biosynthesis